MSPLAIRTRLFRLLLLAIAVTALITAILAGLARLGWAVGHPTPLESHGPLLVLGFLGTVITMERAVALGGRWVWLAPSASAVAVVVALVGLSSTVAAALLMAAGVGLVAIFAAAHRIQPELHIRVMGAGAVCWIFAGIGLLTGAAGHELVPSLAGFLVLTIVGERLELTRLIGVSRMSQIWLLTASGFVLAGVSAAPASARLGALLTGVGFLGAASWLARHDIARRTVRTPGITRYMAVALLAGYGWLGLAGGIWSLVGLTPGTFAYDAAVHSVFLGFVFSMVFAHAPVIVPVLSGVSLPYHPWFWAPLGLLHVSLIVRVTADAVYWIPGRTWGGMANVAAIALFAIIVLASILTAKGRYPRLGGRTTG